jgi:hypothetical protein
MCFTKRTNTAWHMNQNITYRTQQMWWSKWGFIKNIPERVHWMYCYMSIYSIICVFRNANTGGGGFQTDSIALILRKGTQLLHIENRRRSNAGGEQVWNRRKTKGFTKSNGPIVTPDGWQTNYVPYWNSTRWSLHLMEKHQLYGQTQIIQNLFHYSL